MEKVLAMLKGGHKKFRGSFYAVAQSYSHIVGGREKFALFIRGACKKFYRVLRGGGAQKFWTRHLPIL